MRDEWVPLLVLWVGAVASVLGQLPRRAACQLPPILSQIKGVQPMMTSAQAACTASVRWTVSREGAAANPLSLLTSHCPMRSTRLSKSRGSPSAMLKSVTTYLRSLLAALSRA